MILDKNSIRKIALGFASVSEALVFTLSGFAVGSLLDHFFVRTKPWLTVLLTFVGMIGGFVRMYKLYIKEEESNDDQSKT